MKDSNFLGIQGVDKSMLVDALTLKEGTSFDERVSGLIPFACILSISTCFLFNAL
jgi:hypothetical protein